MPAPKNVLSMMPMAASSLVRVQRTTSVIRMAASPLAEGADREAEEIAIVHDQKRDANAGERRVGEHVADERAATQHGERAGDAGRAAEERGADRHLVAEGKAGHRTGSRLRIASAASSRIVSRPP